MDGKQLKNSILQWAIQGKLVPQNPKDEPAQKLLERIAASRNVGDSRHSERSEESSKGSKKASLRDAKATKQSKNQPSRIYRENGVWYEQAGNAEPKDISEDIPFEIPENWAWCRFGNLVFNRDSERIPLSVDERKSLKKIYDYYGASGVIDKVDNYLFDKPLLLIGEDGANLINRSTPIAFIARGQYWVNNHAHVIDCLNEDLLQYVCTFINAISLVDYVTGTAQPKMNQEKMNSILVAVPPQAEQKRIVAKLEQVLPLAEEYGAAQKELDKLNKELPEALKKSILQEAIQGKLVPQNPKDEPAQKLLERIALARHSERSEESNKGTKKVSLRGAKATKQSKDAFSRIYRDNGSWYEQVGTATPKDISDEIPFEIPENWAWCRLKDYLDVRDGTHDSPKYYSSGIPFVTSKNLVNGQIDFSNVKYISQEDHEAFSIRSKVDDNDILFAMIGSIGNPVLVKKTCEFSIKNVALFKPYNEETDMHYMLLYFQHIQTGLKKIAAGGVQSFISLNVFRNWLFPLPPLAEQKRIVAKLEQLFKVL